MDTASPLPEAVPQITTGTASLHPRPELRPDPRPVPRPVLADLTAAGLVSHEMIGDPALLGDEAEALRALCAEIGGSVWRLDPFHYAFRARPEDLGGRLAALDPADWAAAIEAALRARLGGEIGGDAVWISAADLDAEDAGLAPVLAEAPLLLLRAQERAVAEGLAEASPGAQAVIHARYAVETARLAAGAEPGSALARRLAVIETRQEEILEMMVERAGEAAAFGRLAALLQTALERIDAQGAALAGLAGRIEALGAEAEVQASERAAEQATVISAGMAAEMTAFRRELGLTLAEFLARMEQEATLRTRPGTRAGTQQGVHSGARLPALG